MGDQLQALDQVRSTAIDLGLKFGPKLFIAIPQREVRMLPAQG